MLGRMVFVLAVVSAAVIGCSSGDGDGNEGGTCKVASDCGGNLTCQPITGRSGDFCCPTPASSSTQSNCQSTGTQ